jgi:ubiquinone/menaquinone biosynthesis C-methylase UbiE
LALESTSTAWGEWVSCWIDCDRDTVSRRYDRLAGLIPTFDRLLFLPRTLRQKGVEALSLRRGDRVVDVGCGTGVNFSALYEAVGPNGQIFGVDISPGMLRKAESLCSAGGWKNICLYECDAADLVVPAPIDAILFSLSYNTMSNHRDVLSNVWRQLRSGGRIVIVDARVPPGRWSKLILPFAVWLMKHTLLGNPLVQPWKELAQLTTDIDVVARQFGSYYVCRGVKN